MEPVITAQIVKSLMDSCVIPALTSFGKRLKLMGKIMAIPTEKHFESYYTRIYENLNAMNTLALRNQQLKLKDVYIPLTIHTEFSDLNQTHGNKATSFKVDKFPYDIIRHYKRVIITDTAGMGKSTLAKFLFLKLEEDALGIPIFIELRKLSKKNTLLDEIISQLNGMSGEFDKELLLGLFKKGNFYFILDGFDEIAVSHKDTVIADIKTFIDSLTDNYFILTSRPESITAAFGDFKSFKIKSLKEAEAYSLLSRYDSDGVISSQLIKELKAKKNDSLKEFLKNPLLVTLLFIVYNHKANIPLKKHLFYSQVYDALFESHDLTKGAQNIHKKRTGLDILEFEKILRYIGFISWNKNKLQYSKEQLLHLISKAKEFWPGLKFSENDFLNDLTIAVPLFAKDGVEYRWVHKSLSEYFAALFIYHDTKQKQREILQKLYNSDKLDSYLNLLELYYDIDIVTFNQIFIKPLFSHALAYISQFDPDAVDYFLRSLSFLKDIRVRLTVINKLKDLNEIEDDFKSIIFIPIEIGKGKTKLILLNDKSTENEKGKRGILRVLYHKQHPAVDKYQSVPINYEWTSTLEIDREYTIEDLIQLADGDSSKLGELCELVVSDEIQAQYYLVKEKIEEELEAISKEEKAQTCDFDF